MDMTDKEMLDWLEDNEALVNCADHPKRGPHVAVETRDCCAPRHQHQRSTPSPQAGCPLNDSTD